MNSKWIEIKNENDHSSRYKNYKGDWKGLFCTCKEKIFVVYIEKFNQDRRDSGNKEEKKTLGQKRSAKAVLRSKTINKFTV